MSAPRSVGPDYTGKHRRAGALGPAVRPGPGTRPRAYGLPLPGSGGTPGADAAIPGSWPETGLRPGTGPWPGTGPRAGTGLWPGTGPWPETGLRAETGRWPDAG
jgi:hypothetical protein